MNEGKMPILEYKDPEEQYSGMMSKCKGKLWGKDSSICRLLYKKVQQ